MKDLKTFLTESSNKDKKYILLDDDTIKVDGHSQIYDKAEVKFDVSGNEKIDNSKFE